MEHVDKTIKRFKLILYRVRANGKRQKARCKTRVTRPQIEHSSGHRSQLVLLDWHPCRASLDGIQPKAPSKARPRYATDVSMCVMVGGKFHSRNYHDRISCSAPLQRRHFTRVRFPFAFSEDPSSNSNHHHRHHHPLTSHLSLPSTYHPLNSTDRPTVRPSLTDRRKFYSEYKVLARGMNITSYFIHTH